jgi:hypothetical protein
LQINAYEKGVLVEKKLAFMAKSYTFAQIFKERLWI